MESFITIYKDWLTKRRQQEKEPSTPETRKAMAVLDDMKKRLWNQLPDSRKIEIMSELVIAGILPESAVKVMDIFDARVISI